MDISTPSRISATGTKRISHRAVAIMAALSLSTSSLTIASNNVVHAAVDNGSASFTSNDKARFANEIFFFDFGKLASGEKRQDTWGAQKKTNNEAEFYGKRIKSGDSYTYKEVDGLPKGLEVTVTVDSVTALHDDAVYPNSGPKAGQKIDDGIWARTVTWNDFFRPLNLSNPGSIDRDKKRSNEWFDADTLYPSDPGSMLQISNYLDPQGFANNADHQSNQGYKFSINVEGKLNGKPVDLDLFASDGESTGIKVEDHDNPYGLKDKGQVVKGGVPENLQLTPNGEGGWVVIQDLVGKDKRYYFTDSKPTVPQKVPEGVAPYKPIEVAPNKVWTEKNGAKTYGWVDTELDEQGGPWKAIPMSQPLLVSRSATQISVELDNHARGKTGSRQGVVAGIFLPTDQGDAPESYGEASHILTNWKEEGSPKNDPHIAFQDGNKVGSYIAEFDGGKNWTTDPDNAKGDAEEDLDPNLFKSGFENGNGKVTIPAVAKSSAVVAWVDLNQDGKFEDGERRVGTDNGDGTFTFDWSDAQKTPQPDSAIYARIRVGGEGTSADQIKDANGTITGGEIEDLKFTIDKKVPAVTPSVTVGDFVWIDENGNGIQDDEEKGLAGVTLKLYGPNGEAVTDVNGNPVETATTNADGKYSFKNLPVLKNGEKYTVKVVNTPEGYKPTKPNQGEGSLATWKDSSTGEASTIPGTLSENGAQDLTLDFGFIKQQPEEPADTPSVTVGDFVWIDENGNGIQDDEEKGLAGVTLKLYGPNGEAVTDVNGNPVETATTNADGKYSFKNLPVLKNGEKYTVKVVNTPEGYKPTKPNQGEGSLATWKDSSTGEASTIPGTLSENGAQDLTLDFGFIKQQPSVFDKIPGWGWLLPLLPLIPFLGGGSSSLSNSTTPASTTTVNPAPQHKNPSTTPTPSQHKPSASQQLAKTGASVIGLLTIAGLLVLTGLGVMNLRRKKQ
ncbi:SdrD B-like domain-containing protein [Corynebacterium diphtheriae]|uniref:SdrD B-like domain-containing protein n=9 Tax=Corynebacterium diphtheriae TaxID=1717 RepID=UPI0018CA3043|nr:SdrD B-like domain-containing protein [Corynebacterium diphtheriae]MBG9336178.1 LPXTG cell wall anchor domain-containing protein [Corynebacterium diphtheriae bv. gravis]